MHRCANCLRRIPDVYAPHVYEEAHVFHCSISCLYLAHEKRAKDTPLPLREKIAMCLTLAALIIIFCAVCATAD